MHWHSRLKIHCMNLFFPIEVEFDHKSIMSKLLIVKVFLLSYNESSEK